MGDRLPSPPLAEAVCEFRFVPHGEWDWTIPGRLFDKISGEFSGKAQVNALRVQASINDPKMTQVVIAGPERIQMKRPDGSAMVQVGPYLLTINHLRPYPDWETFRNLIIRVLETWLNRAHDIVLESFVGSLNASYYEWLKRGEV